MGYSTRTFSIFKSSLLFPRFLLTAFNYNFAQIRKDSYVHNENSHSQILFDAESIDGTGPVAVLAHRPDTVVLSDPPGSVHETSKLARVANVENNATQRTELP